MYSVEITVYLSYKMFKHIKSIKDEGFKTYLAFLLSLYL